MATRSMGTLTLNLVMQMGGFEQGADRAERALDKVGKAAARQKDDLMRLLGQIDPVVAEFGRLEKAGAKLKASFEGGLIDQATFTAFNNKLAEQKKRLDQSGNGFAYGALSAKQYQQALRGMPAQITDLVVSLQAGQNPLTVFLQQGGQIKDMFGGIGPAISGLSRAVMGMVTPFTVAAFTVAALGVAYVQAANEEAAFRKSLAATGNQLGLTAGQLKEYAKNIDEASSRVTEGAAGEVLNMLVRDGKVAATSIEGVAGAIANMADTGEADAKKLVEAFGKIAEDPVKGIRELNKAYNFLTPAVEEQIRVLKEQGRTEEAVKLAMDEATKGINARSEEIIKAASSLAKGFNEVTSAAKEAWDAVKRLFDGPDLDEQLANTERQIKRYQALGNTKVAGQFSSRLEDLLALKNEQELAAEVGKERKKLADQYAADQERITKALEKTVTAEQKARKEIEETRKSFERQRAQFPNDPRYSEAAFKDYERKTLAAAAKKDTRGAGPKDDPTKALLDNQLKEIERAAKQEAAIYSDRNKAIENANKQGLLSIEEYYAQQKKALDENTEAQRKAIDEQIKLLQANQAADKTAKGRAETQGKINALLDKQADLEREAAGRITDLGQRQKAATEAYRKSVEDVNIQLETMLGNLGKAAGMRFDAAFADRIAQAEREGDTGTVSKIRQLRAYQVVQADVNALQAQSSEIMSQLQRDEERVAIGRQLGIEGELSGLVKIGEARTRAYNSLRDQLQIYENLRAIDPAALTEEQRVAMEKFAPQVDAARLQLLQLSASLDPLGDKINGIFEDAFGDAFADFVTGTKTAKEAFQAFGQSVLKQLAQIAAKEAATAIFGGSKGGGGGSGFGGIFSAIGKIFGFAEGGYTGSGGKHQPAGVVHAGEYVFSQEDVRAAGGPAGMDALRRGLRGYASGGYVAAPKLPQVAQRSMSANITVNVPAGSPAETRRAAGAGAKEALAAFSMAQRYS